MTAADRNARRTAAAVPGDLRRLLRSQHATHTLRLRLAAELEEARMKIPVTMKAKENEK